MDLREAIVNGKIEEFTEMSRKLHFPEDLLRVDLTTKTLQNSDA